MEEVERIRERLHKFADMVTSHEAKIGAHEVLLKALTDGYSTLGSRMASREQLEGHMNLINAELGHIREDIAPMKKAINWAAAIVIGAVILALLGLVMGRPSVP